MKRIVKILLSFVLIVTICCSLLSINTFAAGSAISLANSTVTVGEDVSVTLTFDAGEAMYSVSGVINYDTSILEYKSGNASGGAGVVKIVDSPPSGETKVSYTLTFKTLAAGAASISLSDCYYVSSGPDGGAGGAGPLVALSGATATQNVMDVTLSDNANLKSMYLSSGTLSPAFSPDVTEYSVTVDNSVKQCKISAVAEDSAATIQVTGSANLKIGTNTRSVVVTAPNGAQKTYNLTITRESTVKNPESSTDSTSSQTEPSDDQNLKVTIDGVEHTLPEDISAIALFKGFSLAKTIHNGIEIPVAVDANNHYKIYYLKSNTDEKYYPYTYNEKTKTFNKLVYFTQGEYTYILADSPDEKALLENYYATSTTILDFTVNCYANSQQPDFYYIYCYNGSDFGYYRYDAAEKTIQRFPDMQLSFEEPEDDVPVINETPKTLKERFNSLSSNSKLVLFLIILFTIALVVLLVLFIINLFKRLRYGNAAPDIEEFEIEDISIDGFVLEDEVTEVNDDEN